MDSQKPNTSLKEFKSSHPFWKKSSLLLISYLIISSLALSQLACPKKQAVNRAGAVKILEHARDYRFWKKLSDRKMVSSHGKETNAIIYANKLAYPVNIGKAKLPYPEGAMFVVVHYNLREEPLPNVHVMRKMGPQYDPDNNNWRYSVVNHSTWVVQKDGIVIKCVQCHQKRRERDFTPYMKKDFITN